ncbi:MAG: sugar ABC transporter substrate-binding protein [Anaerolineales bacterium]|nr:sugar ABC transporter substrate-binding protein [Anaerolineales bacterium]
MSNKLYFLIITLLAALLVACNTPAEQPAPAEETETTTETTETESEEAAPETEAETGERTTIQVMLVDYIPDVTDVWLEEEVVPAFQEEYPNVDVEFVYVNWGTLDETVQGYFAAESGADIINLGSEYVAEYGDRLAPLNAQMAEWGELDQFVPATLDTVTWDGEVRGLPWLTAPRAVMCRTDILEELGFDGAPTTFEEMIAVAEAGTIIEDNALVRQGFMADGLLNNWQEFINLIWSNGGTVYNEDGTPNLNSPEAKAALEFMNARRAAILPSDTIAGLPEASGSRLATGEVGCRWGNLWGAPPTDDPLWENISLSPGFVSEEFGTEPVAQVFNDWLAIPAYSENLDTAVAFLQFLGSAENLNAYNEQFGSFPPRQDAWFGYVDDPIMQEMGQIMSDYGVGFADIRETAQLRDILVAEIDAYFSGLQDVDTALDNINTQYEDVLRDAGRIN